MVQKKWTKILFCRTWAASSSYTWSPFKKKPSLLRMRWGNIWTKVLVILLWVKTLALGFFIAKSMTEKANDKDVNRNDTSQCPSLWCVHHFLFLKGNCSSELTAEKSSLFEWIVYKTCLKSINKDIFWQSLCVLYLLSPVFKGQLLGPWSAVLHNLMFFTDGVLVWQPARNAGFPEGVFGDTWRWDIFFLRF